LTTARVLRILRRSSGHAFKDGLGGNPNRGTTGSRCKRHGDIQAYDALAARPSLLTLYANSTDGNFKPTAFADQQSLKASNIPANHYYGQVDFEASPLDRRSTRLRGSSWWELAEGLEPGI